MARADDPVVEAPPGPDAVASYARGVRLVLTATLFWSLAGLVIRLMEEAVGWQIIFWRGLSLGFTVLTLLAIQHRGRLWSLVRNAGWPAFWAGFFSSTAGMFYVMALGEITVANALLMTAMSPFVAALVARLTMGEPVARTTLIAMSIAAVGITIMVQGAVARGLLLGNLLAFGSAVSFGLFGVMLRRGRRNDMMPAVLAAASITTVVAGWALLVQGMLQAAPLDRFDLPWRDLLLCVFLGAVQQGVGTTSFTKGSRFIPAAHLQLFAMTELILAPLWTWLFVAEVPASTTLLGGSIVVLALLVQARAGLRPARPGGS